VEELRFYLDLVEQLGDPYTIFERDGKAEEVPDSSRRVPGAHRRDPDPPGDGPGLSDFLFSSP
jgi:hypothetical protein